MPALKMKDSKHALKWLFVALILILVSCVGASRIQTSGGAVTVETHNIPTNNGRYISINLFKPQSATPENPAPLIIASPGTYNSKEMQDVPAVEFSRRGFVVITFDPYFHGHSSAAEDPYTVMPYSLSGGQIELVEYAHAMLDYVDKTRIGVTGHSMGGRISMNTANYYSRQVMAALKEVEASGREITEADRAEAYKLMKINASFPVGAVVTEQIAAEFLCNMGVNNGIYDESFKVGEWILVNSGLPEGEKITETTLELGKFYGNAADMTLRAAFREPETHPWNHFSHSTTRNMLNFFFTAFQLENPIAPDDQVWLWKELLNSLGIAGLFLLIVPLTALLLKVPCFAGLAHPEPKRLPALADSQSKKFFWWMWVLGWAISGLSLFPVALWANKIFGVNISLNAATVRFFPQNITNGILLWALFNAVTGLILFWLSCSRGRKNGVTSAMWGIGTSLKEFLGYAVLAFCVYFIFYGVINLADAVFVTDFRLWILAVKTFKLSLLPTCVGYAMLFFPYYVVNSISVNSASRVEGQEEWKNMFICAAGNVLGILVLAVMQYVTLFARGSVLFVDWNFPLLQSMGLIIWLFLAVYISRYLFRLTGKVWLGAMVNCLIIVTIGCGNTMQHVPF